MSRRIARLVVRGALIGAVLIALIVRGAVGVALGLGAAAVLIGLVIGDIRRGSAALRRVRARLRDARHWPAEAKPDRDGSDPYEDDRVTGLWNGCRVYVALDAKGAYLAVPLVRWPAGVVVERGGAGDAVTGDAAFDAVIGARGDEALCRGALSAQVRDHLVALCEGFTWAVRDERGAAREERGAALELRVPDAQIRQLEAALDRAVALAEALPDPADDPMARVFAIAQADPVAAVRARHYRWLVARGWDIPAVHRAAAADPDPEIAAWGAAELAPSAGVFR